MKEEVRRKWQEGETEPGAEGSDGAGQVFLYEIRRGGVVIWRCLSRDERAVIPERIGGLPVTELAPYAFSAHQDPEELRGKTRTKSIWEEELPELCGNQLREVVLPETIRRVGRYCFYNCEQLESLSFGGELRDWGSGAFTGCHQIGRIRVHMEEEGASSLKDVLSEIREALEVDYFCGIPGKECHARLIFPEFFEEGVENTPARILETHVHGSGLYYRNCFRQRAFQFSEYDSRFAYARAEESRETLIEMAVNRLRYPHQLSAEARSVYESYLREEKSAAAAQVLRAGDPGYLQWFLERMAGKDAPLSEEEKMGLLSEMREMAGKQGDAQAVSRLMEYTHQNRPKRPVDPFEL